MHLVVGVAFYLLSSRSACFVYLFSADTWERGRGRAERSERRGGEAD